MIAAIVIMSVVPRPSQREVRIKQGYDLLLVSVMVRSERSAGSGVVVYSSPSESYVLTNLHVCGILDAKSKVWNNLKNYPISAVKIYREHDLCMIKIKADLGHHAVISHDPYRTGDQAMTAGFPHGQSIVIQKGYIGMRIKVKDIPEYLMTGLIIQPGDSGSGVFNAKGELMAMIFGMSPSNNDVGFGWAVPLFYIYDFVELKSPQLPWLPIK